FAGLVGSDPVKTPVIDETLAQSTALNYFEWKKGRKAAEGIKQSQLVAGYHMYRISGGEDAPANRPTSEFENGMQYAALVYAKAPLLHLEEKKLVGDVAYAKALRAYVDAWRYKWACAECFTEELVRASPGNAAKLRALKKRWFDEAHGDEDLGKPDIGKMVEAMTGQKM